MTRTSSPATSTPGDPKTTENTPTQSLGDTPVYTTTHEWLPIAARLEPLDDDGDPRPAVARHPLLSFAELPPHQARILNYDARVAPGVVRYGLPPRIKLPDATRIQDMVQIHSQICEAHPELEIGSITFKKSRPRIVDIHRPSSQPYNTETPIWLSGERLIFIAAAGRVKETWITIVIRDIEDASFDAVCRGLRDFLSPHEILDYWRGILNYTDSHGDTYRFGNGELYMLVKLDMREGLRHGLRSPKDVASSLPGFFAIGGRKYKLNYAARLDHCYFCKSTKFFEHHCFADCTSRR